MVLPKALISGPNEAPITIDIVLLHAGRGVALLETPPHWTPDAPQRLRRRLERARFMAIYPGHLPIVHAQLLRGALSELPRVLAEGFEAEPPLDLPGGDAWMLAVSRALMATPHATPEALEPLPTMPARSFPRGLATGVAGLALVAAMGGAFLVLRHDAPVVPPAGQAMAGTAAGALAGAETPNAPAEATLPPGMAMPAVLRLAAAGALKEAAQAETPDAVPADPSRADGPRMAPGEPLPQLPKEMPPALRLLIAAETVPAPPGPVTMPGLAPAPPLTPPSPPVLPPDPVPGNQTAGAAPPSLPATPAMPMAGIPGPPDAAAEPPTLGGPDGGMAAEPPPEPASTVPAAAPVAVAPPPAPALPAVPDRADPAVARPGATVQAAPPEQAPPEPAPPGLAEQAGQGVAAATPQPGTAAPALPSQPAGQELADARPQPGPAAAPPRRGDPALVASLMRRGDALLALGDVSAARRFYERAAEAGSAAAARAVARTHDPAELDALGARGIRPDPEAAADWYRRADALAAQEPRR